MIMLEIIEPGDKGELTTIIDRARLDETINDNIPWVAVGTRFVVDGEVIATKGETE